MKISRYPILLLALFLSTAVPASVDAQVIMETLPEFSGAQFDENAPYPLPAVLVGTFGYSIPAGHSIFSAMISGTFGNSQANSSGGVDLFLGSVLVGQCVKNNPCWVGGPHVPWSYTFSGAEFAALMSGSIDLTAVQTSEFIIRLGETTLLIEHGPSNVVPEPASMILLGSGLAGLAGAARRRRRQTDA